MEDLTLDLLTFRREVVKTYLKKYHQPRLQAGRPSRDRILVLPENRRISMDVRTNRVDHYQSHLDTTGSSGVSYSPLMIPFTGETDCRVSNFNF